MTRLHLEDIDALSLSVEVDTRAPAETIFVYLDISNSMTTDVDFPGDEPDRGGFQARQLDLDSDENWARGDLSDSHELGQYDNTDEGDVERQKIVRQAFKRWENMKGFLRIADAWGRLPKV